MFESLKEYFKIHQKIKLKKIEMKPKNIKTIYL